MSHDVFISHSSADKRAADAACNLLEARGIRCWIAPRDIRLRSNWGESNITAIEQTRIMLLLLSKQANNSPQIRREVERGGQLIDHYHPGAAGKRDARWRKK
jgi:hypothetical protein